MSLTEAIGIGALAACAIFVWTFVTWKLLETTATYRVSLFNCNSSGSKRTDLGIVYQAKQAKNQHNSALREMISICYAGRWQKH